jgi:hypothetical protein
VPVREGDEFEFKVRADRPARPLSVRTLTRAAQVDESKGRLRCTRLFSLPRGTVRAETVLPGRFAVRRWETA